MPARCQQKKKKTPKRLLSFLVVRPNLGVEPPDRLVLVQDERGGVADDVVDPSADAERVHQQSNGQPEVLVADGSEEAPFKTTSRKTR